jgi:hypothetical protein
MWWLADSKSPASSPPAKSAASSAAPSSKARAEIPAAEPPKAKSAPEPRPVRETRESRPPEPAPVEAAPAKATLRIETDVPGASVLVDRIGVGDAPITIPNLTPGSHRVNVVAPGYEGYAETLELEPGTRTLSIKFREIKLDESLVAIHKHGVGSCRGQLSASPEGMRYTPAQGDHGFSVTLPAITTLEVDYMEKSLRLTAQGRTFNFTPADGNVEKLANFQDNVSKARARVIRESGSGAPR